MGKKPSYDALEKQVSRLENANAELKAQVQSNTYFNALLENTDDGIVIIDEKGIPRAFNTAYGKSIKDTIGIEMKPGIEPYRYLKDPDAVKFWEKIKERALNGERFRVDSKHTDDDGLTRYFEFALCPIRSGQKFLGYVQISRDITERMALMEKLREKEILLEYSEKMTDIGSFIWDLRTNNLVWSTNMYAIHGVRAEEYQDRLLEENRRFIHPEDREAVIRQIDDMLASKKIWPMNFRILRPDGKERKIISNGEFELDEQGTPLKCIGIYQDITETKQMERDLANRNAFIETVLENLPIGVAVTSLSTGVSSLINKKFEEIYGWSKEDIPDLRSFFQKVYPDPEYRRKIRKKVVEDVMSGDPSRMQWENLNAITKRGEKRIILSHTIPLFDQDLIINTVLNTTERFKMTESLKEYEERYKALFDRSLDCISIYDIEGKFIDANHAYSILTEYTQEELKNLEGMIVVHPDSRRDFLKARAQLLKEGRQEELGVYKFLTKSGITKFIEIRRSIIHKNNEPYAVQSFIRDISLRKRIEAELEKKVKSLDQAEKIAKLGYFEFNFLSGEFYRSQGLFRLLGYTENDDPNSISTGIFPKFIHDEDKEDVDRWIKRFIENPSPMDIEFRIIQKSGTIIRVLTVVRVIFDSTQNPITAIGILQDITHQHQLEEQLRYSHKMESIGTLVGGIAHDFNNILGIILGNAELAMEEIPEGYASKNFISEIRKATLKGRTIVQQLLSFTRKEDEQLRPTEIIPIINEVLKLINSMAGPNIKIQKSLPDFSVPILANANQMHQLLTNICTNAIESIDIKGTIEVSIENILTKTFPLRSTPDIPQGNYVCIKIKDTGSGIEPDIFNRIFDPYFTTKEFGKGPGLGLSVVHGIVKSHGGFIHVESRLNQGTCVEVYFPVIEPGPEEEKKNIERIMPVGGEKILYVDDEEGLVLLGKSILEKLGYTVKGCTDPMEALSLVTSDPQAFDLVITDMSMPGLTGEELTDKIKNLNPKLPVILCSGYSDLIDEKSLKESKIYAYLSKPINLKHLAQTVRGALNSK